MKSAFRSSRSLVLRGVRRASPRGSYRPIAGTAAGLRRSQQSAVLERARRRVREPLARAARARHRHARRRTPGGRSGAASSEHAQCRRLRRRHRRAGTSIDAGTTRPYYRSTYVFVSPRAPRTSRLRVARRSRAAPAAVGVQMIGDDFANSPPAHALSRRGIITQRRRLLGAGRLLAAEPAGADRRGGRARRRRRRDRLGPARRVLRGTPGNVPSISRPFRPHADPPIFRSRSTSPWRCDAATTRAPRARRLHRAPPRRDIDGSWTHTTSRASTASQRLEENSMTRRLRPRRRWRSRLPARAGCEREKRELPCSCRRQRRDPTRCTPTDLVPGEPQPPRRRAVPTRTTPTAMGEGKRLFAAYNCNGCHAQGGGGIGPPLMDSTMDLRVLARSDLLDHRRRAGPTGCRHSAGTSLTIRSGSSSRTCSR